jgi:hypothetical protein
MASDRRILELALRGLEAERDVIASEIAELHARLGGRVAKARRRRATKAIGREVARKTRRGMRAVKKKESRKLSNAQRQAISERMMKLWAMRRRAKGQSSLLASPPWSQNGKQRMAAFVRAS